MDKEQCVIIQHTSKPLTFSNGKEANMGFKCCFSKKSHRSLACVDELRHKFSCFSLYILNFF